MPDHNAYLRRMRAQRIAAGNCAQCDRPRRLRAYLCDTCAELANAKRRRRTGHKPWQPGGRGGKPLI